MKESSTFPINTVISPGPSPKEDPVPSGLAASGTTSAPSSPSAMFSALLHEAGFRHAFFTRIGGVSLPPWDSLSFAVGVGDTPEAVEENLSRAAKVLKIPKDKLYFLSQVHGSAYKILDGTEARHEVVRSVGDITLSRAEGVGCGIRTADCVPVLVGDRRSGAVAAIHSGWRGTAARVVVTGVDALREQIGAAGDLVAAIGPHIELCCFEVGDDVAAELSRAARPSACESLIQRGLSGKARVDLRRLVRAQLEEIGLAPGAIDDVRACTVCDSARFHSFRRDRDRSGRMLSAIVSRAPVG
jgi:polyphenol oxidase